MSGKHISPEEVGRLSLQLRYTCLTSGCI